MMPFIALIGFLTCTDPSLWEKITALSTVALALIGVVGTIAALRTLKVIRIQTADLHEQVVAAKNSAETARTSAEAAKASADALISSERAWVLASILNFRIAPKTRHSELVYTVLCRNEGRTPAWITELKLKLLLLDSESLDSLPQHPELADLKNQLSARISLGPQQETQINGSEVFEGVSTPRTWAVIYGVVTYKHLFSKTEGKTTFGYKREADGLVPLRGYPEYNENT